MNADVTLALVREMLWTGVLVSAPILGVALLVGLLVSILQVVTQIQEMTLTFIPKMLAIVLVLAVCGHWMLTTLMQYMVLLYQSIPALL